MSVALINNEEISKIACLGELLADMNHNEVGAILSEQNTKACNYSYNESRTREFKFVKPASTLIDTWEALDDIYFFYQQCHTPEFTSYSRPHSILMTIWDNALAEIDKSTQQTFDNKFGRRCHVKYGYAGFYYLLAEENNMYIVAKHEWGENAWEEIKVPKASVEITEGDCWRISNARIKSFRKAIKESADNLVAESDAEQEKWSTDKDSTNEKIKQLAPEGTKAVIVANLLKNDCGHNDDYYGSKTKRRVILAFSNHTRQLFPEMRKAAANLSETEHLTVKNSDNEHRENYSMGRGVYLTEGNTYHGWEIKKERLTDSMEISSPHELLPDEVYKNGKAKTKKIKNDEDIRKTITTINGVKVIKNVTRNNIELHFGSKPDKSKLEALNKSKSFNYFGKGKFWHSTLNDSSLLTIRNILIPTPAYF